MSLLITCFVHKPTIDLLPGFVAAVRHQGGLKQHRMLFVAPPSLIAKVQQETASLHEVCGVVDVVQGNREPQGRPNYAHNMMVQDAFSALAATNVGNFPVLLCDPKCTPLTPNCWDSLELEHRREGKLVTGFFHRFPPPRHEEEFMDICGIWPPNLKRDAGHIESLLRAVNHNAHAFNGREVQRVEEYIYGSIMGQSPYCRSKLMSFGATSEPSSVFHIGCADGTVAKAVLQAPARETEPEAGDAPAANPVADALLAQRVAALEERVAALEKRPVSTAEPKLDAPALSGDLPVLPDDIQGRDIILAVYELLAAATEPVTIAEAVGQLRGGHSTLTQPMLKMIIKGTNGNTGLCIENNEIKRIAA